MDRDWVLIIVIGVSVGTIFFFQDILLRDLGPFSIALARVTFAALTGWVLLTVAGVDWRIPIHVLPLAMLVGLMMFVVPFVVYPTAQLYIATGIAGIVNAMTPVMVVIISHFWPGGEKATRFKALGVLSGFVGIVFLTIPAMQPGQGSELLATLMVLLAPVGFAIAMNIVRQCEGIETKVIVTWAFTFATLILLPVAGFFEGVPEKIQPASWAAAAFLGICLTGFAFFTAFDVMKRSGPTKTSTITFIAPISTLIVGALAFGERLEMPHFVGMAAIFIGLFLIDGALLRRKLN